MPVEGVLRSRVTTDEVEVASETIRKVYPGAEVHEPEGGRPFSSSMGVVAGGGIMFVAVDQVASCSATMPVQDSYMIGGATDSAFQVMTGRTQLDASRPFLYPDVPVLARWDQEVHVQLLQLDRASVEQVAHARSGSAPDTFWFTGSAPVSPEAGRYWSSTVTHARRIISDGEAFGNALIRHDLLQMLASVLLAVFPNTHSDPTSPDVRPTPASVRRAISYMEDHAGEPVTLAQVAEAARLSPRGLQDAFRRHLGTTPIVHLGQLRLDGARQDLLAADPAGDSVAGIARRWGFAHLGRFSGTYRAAFGELPSHTLNR